MSQVNILQAEFKLCEARYFLRQMKISPDKQTFLFNLDAFLSASRSVTFVLRTEFSKDARFQEWYDSKQQEMQTDPLLKFFRDMRNVTVKERAPDVMAETHVSRVEIVRVTDAGSLTKISADGREEVFHLGSEKVKSETKQPEESSVTRYFFVEKPEEDIITLCSLYADKLATIVEEAKRIVV